MNRIQQRNIKIKKLREQGIILSEIAKKFKISNERVRQILLLPKTNWTNYIVNVVNVKYCKTHKKTYLTSCQYCKIKKEYKKRINKLADKFLEIECQRLSRPDRRAEIVCQRKMLIKYLRDKHRLSFLEIARLLKRDHTSVSSLYYKN